MIAFSGIDGAGKSTQIGLLKVHLVDNGFNVLVFWSRGGYSPGMMFLKKLMDGNMLIIQSLQLLILIGILSINLHQSIPVADQAMKIEIKSSEKQVSSKISK